MTNEELIRYVRARCIVQPNGCWLWQGGTDANGYGMFNDGGRTRYVHRAVCEAIHGPLPRELLARHTCNTPPCAAPEHLIPGTHSDNAKDAIAAGVEFGKLQSAKTHCPQGHPFDEANTYRRPNGARGCRTCMRLASQVWKLKQKRASV